MFSSWHKANQPVKPLASKSKPSKRAGTSFLKNQNLLQRIMFPSCLKIYCIYDLTDHVQKPTIPISGGIVSETWENIPSNLTSIHPLPPFSSYNTSPHRKTINRWVGWEQLSVRAARHLGKQASLLWFPGWREEGRPQLDCPSHWVEPEKLDKNHCYLSLSSSNLLAAHTSSHKSGHTNWE